MPILHRTADAYKQWHGILQNFPRLTRYTLGAKIENLFLESVELILKAGYSSRDQKLLFVLNACTKLDALKYFLQIAWEIKALDTKKYSALSQPLSEIGKMLGGWRKQLDKKTSME